MIMNKVNDGLDERIAGRLKERQRKVDSMSRWEKKPHSRNIMPIASVLAAACLAGVVFFIPWGNSDVEWQEASRSASPEIRQLIDGKSEEEAQKIIDMKIATSDSIIKVLHAAEPDEETLYEIEAENQKIEALKNFRKEIR